MPRTHLLTDFELMILLAALRVEETAYGVEIAREIERLSGRRVLLVGSAGGRLDHLLGLLVLLGAEPYAALELDAIVGGSLVHVIRAERRLAGEPGELLSLFALGGAATGVVTEGLAYPLEGETLEPGSSRGISNVFEGAEARIAVGTGVLLAIRPGRAEPEGRS